MLAIFSASGGSGGGGGLAWLLSPGTLAELLGTNLALVAIAYHAYLLRVYVRRWSSHSSRGKRHRN